MVMTTGNIYEGFERTDRVDHRASLDINHEAYRCPVSTPANGKRPLQHKIPQSLTFVSLDFSQLKSSKKHVEHPTKVSDLVKQKNNHFRMPRTRNFDYYYVDKKFQKRLAGHSNTRWLRALCAQPVDEIFGKYRVQTEVKTQHDTMSRAFSTPGERAILEAWESNSNSRRMGSATSRSSRKSESTQRTISPQLTIMTKSLCRTQESSRNDSRNDSRIDSVPHPPSLGGTAESSRAPSRNRNYREQTAEFMSLNENVPYIGDSYYNQFQRKETKFPDIKDKKSTPIMGKQRKYFNNGYQSKKYAVDRQDSPSSSSVHSGPQPQFLLDLRNQQQSQTFTLCILNEDTGTEQE